MTGAGFINIALLAVVVVAVGYLIAALLYPEKF